jgi:hypothetical protein
METIREKLINLLLEDMKWKLYENTKKELKLQLEQIIDSNINSDKDIKENFDFLNLVETRKSIENININDFINMQIEDDTYLYYIIKSGLYNL